LSHDAGESTAKLGDAAVQWLLVTVPEAANNLSKWDARRIDPNLPWPFVRGDWGRFEAVPEAYSARTGNG
jgi:hypothetical protein